MHSVKFLIKFGATSAVLCYIVIAVPGRSSSSLELVTAPGFLFSRLPKPHYPRRTMSAMRSPIIIMVGLIGARTKSGIMEASATRRPSMPRTLPYWSTTALESLPGPILQVRHHH